MSATEKKIKARKADAFSPSPSRKKDAFNLGSGIYSKEAVEASRRDRQFRLEQRRNESHQREMEFRAISSRRSFLFKLLNALILVFALVSMIVLGIGISQTWFTADSLIPTILFILLSVNVLHSILGICAASKFNQGLLSCVSPS